jgi:predicted DNA-binding transcriptional regulator YafY
MANQFSNTIKFLKAVNLLSSPNGATVRKLADGLGISRRSVFRLLRTLDELGFPLTDDKPQCKGEKTYRLASSYVMKLPNITIPDPRLSKEELIFILALLKTCKKHSLLKETPMLKSVKGKLSAMVTNGKMYDMGKKRH